MSIRVKDGGYYVRYRDESRKEYSKYLGKGENARRAAEALDNKIKSENKLRRAMKSQNRLLRLALGLGPISQTTSLYSFEEFKRKIKCLLDDPNMTLGIVFDVIMKDLDLPFGPTEVGVTDLGKGRAGLGLGMIGLFYFGLVILSLGQGLRFCPGSSAVCFSEVFERVDPLFALLVLPYTH